MATIPTDPPPQPMPPLGPEPQPPTGPQPTPVPVQEPGGAPVPDRLPGDGGPPQSVG